MPTVIRETTAQLMLAPSRITPATLRAGLLAQVRRLMLLCIASLLFSGGTSNVDAASLEDVQQRVRQVLGRRSVRSAQWGIEVMDSANDRVVFALDAEQLFKPASVIKVLTTAVALEKLGPDFRFRTGVYTDGTVGPTASSLETSSSSAEEIRIYWTRSGSWIRPSKGLRNDCGLWEFGESTATLSVTIVISNTQASATVGRLKTWKEVTPRPSVR